MNTIPIAINYRGIVLKGYADLLSITQNSIPSSMRVYIQGWCLGVLSLNGEHWSMDKPIDPKFIQKLGDYIFSYSQALKN